MRGLRTARVVVIDDVEAEAMPMIQALGRIGIGCVHIPGDKVEHLPEKPLSGVRVVFLDMQLGTQGTDRQIGAHTAKVFTRVVAKGGGPVVLVLWTKHPEYVDAFKQALFESEPGFRTGVIVTSFEKPQAAENISVDDLLQNIKKLMADARPIEALWVWEQLAHEATTETTAAVCQIAESRTNIQVADSEAECLRKWVGALGHLFRSLIQASVGQSGDATTAFEDLLLALASIHQDRLDSQVMRSDQVDLKSIFDVEWAGLSSAEQIALNTIFLTAPVRPDDIVVQPGNIYIPCDDAGDDCLHKKCAVDRVMLVEEILRLTKDQEFKRADDSLKSLKARTPDDAEKIKVATEERRKQIEGIACQCLPALVELTPACDFFQRTCRVARFAAGLLLPAPLEHLSQKKDSLRRIEAVSVAGHEGSWSLIISGRLPFSLPLTGAGIKVVPALRLRTGVLLDVQNWFQNQGARPGYLKAEPGKE